ncbi:Periplasmic (NiFeSe) hydrogenase large subunit [Pelotomaculum schinkii]|uniref:Periplasmic (NiFeSe) hydrogenase large subunit n=1 Tax=Pelotomaculum schinkii TaxID=78350 RepID=A0A4Y7R9N3_9FIRM|nr:MULTISPECIES: nickel-dependent hydrogenase large subunit [Pelotomaculum]TEB05361.1 Periplasmic (NiFeSe) hydrogenase large subunit [Pelotomaculum schinkii]TEB17310.1 Periplasmic (NiFeSe) hydrogenase large subunit [Pelotomaculum sp. FP]
MSKKRVMFSPVTRLSGLLSVEVVEERGGIIEAKAGGTLFRGIEAIMKGRHITDAVYLTQRVCGICSLAHGTVAGYLLDGLYDHELPENAQYLRNIMLAADTLQNHIRHFYFFSLPDYVKMPEQPPFLNQNLHDHRLSQQDNARLVNHYFRSVAVSQECHQLLTVFGGKIPHQHSFVHGGVAVAPTADKISQCLALIHSVHSFVKECLVPDTELIASAYRDYFRIGGTPGRFLSFGMFRFGSKNQSPLWRSGVLAGAQLSVPDVRLISEDITSSWFVNADGQEIPSPSKPAAYSYIKSVQYAGQTFEMGPLARMLINGFYRGGNSAMDRIYARSMETLLITELVIDWLNKLVPGPPPIQQKKVPVKEYAVAATDVMRGALLHSARIKGEQVEEYRIITPTAWNFSPKNNKVQTGPVESALTGTVIPGPDMLYTVLGRIIRSFDPCISCGTHVLNAKGDLTGKMVF